MAANGVPAAMGARAIGEHALIGDCRTAALVDGDGVIDWLCLPYFSSPGVFAALLDRGAGGEFALRALGGVSATRRYLDGSAVLETSYRSDGGAARVLDAMAIPTDPDALQPLREVLRIVEGVEGTVDFELRLCPRPDYGRCAPRLRLAGRTAAVCRWKGELLLLRTEVPLRVAEDGAVVGMIRVRAGERVRVSLGFARVDMAVIAPLGTAADTRLQRTLHWWLAWSARCNYQGPYREAVVRSAVVLRLLSFTSSGALLAAPTTSLPSLPGGSGDGNWDYRYCWLRDSALVMRCFTGLGLRAEAESFLYWLLHATRLTWPRLQVMYDVHGRSPLRERVLPHLAGFRGVAPVRIGNGAREQLQLDVYGGVLAAVAEYVRTGGRLYADEARLAAGLARPVCRSWRCKDNGIWEVRDQRRHYTFSRMMCWVALDRLLELGERGSVRVDAAWLRAERDAIASDIEAGGGFDAAAGAYVGELRGTWLDASVLLAANLGYGAPDSARMRSTRQALYSRQGRGALLQRTESTFAPIPPEGGFVACSFWAIEQLARSGDRQMAARQFEQMLDHAGPLGLYAEQIDLDTGAQLGNYPQAFSHAGLISAALAIAAAANAPATSET